MAKSKKSESTDLEFMDLEKEFGDIFTDAEDLVDNPKEVVSMSPAFDIGLSGGVPQGLVAICAGLPKCGKSTTLLSFAANFQAQFPDKRVFYFDVENRLKPMNLTGIRGLKISKDRFKIVRPKIQANGDVKIWSAEQYLKMVKNIIDNNPGCCIIFDSASALCSEKELLEDPKGNIRSVGPKLMSHFLRQNATKIGVNNIIFWSVHHLYANTSGYGEHWLEDGGTKIQYYLDVRIRAKKHEPWPANGPQVGQKITWTIKCSALGPPNQEIQSFIRFGEGIDRAEEILEFAVGLGYIVKSGSWFSFADTEMFNDQKFQGRENMNAYLKTQPEFLDRLTKLVMTDFGFKQENTEQDLES